MGSPLPSPLTGRLPILSFSARRATHLLRMFWTVLANVKWISLMLLALPVFWCLGDEPMMHEPGAVPKTLARRVIALPLTDPLVVSKNSCRKASEARPPLLALACCRVCWTIPGRHRAQVSRARCVLKIGRRELTAWVVFAHRLEAVGAGDAACGGMTPPTRVRVWAVASQNLVSRVVGPGKCGKTFKRGTCHA